MHYYGKVIKEQAVVNIKALQEEMAQMKSSQMKSAVKSKQYYAGCNFSYFLNMMNGAVIHYYYTVGGLPSNGWSMGRICFCVNSTNGISIFCCSLYDMHIQNPFSQDIIAWLKFFPLLQEETASVLDVHACCICPADPLLSSFLDYKL